MKPQCTTVFVIREVSTRKLVKLGAKCGWISHGAACSAFHLHMKPDYSELEKTKKSLYWHQTEYVIEEIQ